MDYLPKPVILIALILALGLSVWLFSLNTAQKGQIKQNLSQIKELQEKLSKCTATSNTISIRKIKGKNATDISQTLKTIKTSSIDSLQALAPLDKWQNACDTLGVVAWFCEMGYRDRQMYERLSKK